MLSPLIFKPVTSLVVSSGLVGLSGFVVPPGFSSGLVVSPGLLGLSVSPGLGLEVSPFPPVVGVSLFPGSSLGVVGWLLLELLLVVPELVL